MIIKIILYIILLWLLKFLNIMYEWTVLEIAYRSIIVLGVLLIISLVSVWFRVKISMDVEPDRVVKGKEIPVRITVDNRSLLPVMILKIKFKCSNCLYDEKSLNETSFPVSRWGKMSFRFNIIPGSCGNMIIAMQREYVQDWLKIFSITKKLNKQVIIPVLPNFNGDIMEEQKPNNAVYVDSDVYSKDRPGDDPSEVFDIRQMNYGDSIHRINWKMSARKETYMVNDYSLPQGNGTVIILDNCVSKKEDINPYVLDRLFEKTLSVSVNLSEYGIIHKILWFHKESGVCMSENVRPDDSISTVFFKIYESGIYIGDESVTDSILNDHGKNTMSHIYYITSRISIEDIQRIKDEQKNAMIKVFLCSDNLSKEEIDYCEAIDIDVEVI